MNFANQDPFQNMRRQHEAMQKRLREQQQQALFQLQQQQQRRRREAMQQDLMKRTSESLREQMARQQKQMRDMQQRQREMAYWAAQEHLPAAKPSFLIRLLRWIVTVIVLVLALGVMFFVLLLFLNAMR